jgi:catechol 2,3-dioxygenase-like lactoylglutathione lyase family enzyme
MKRFHVHVAVDDLDASIRFYSTVFGAQPTVQKTDHAKWMMEDPRLNFALSKRGAKAGLDHLGFQVDTEEELKTLRGQVAAAEIAALDQPQAQCCYARSDKYWMTDPQGIAWETYHTLGEAEIYGVDRAKVSESGACCAPGPQAVSIAERKTEGTSCC